MKIKRVVTHVLEVDLPHGEVFAYSQGWYHKRRSLIVEIETEDGIVGYGEAFGPPQSNAAIVNEVYLPILVNRNPLERESLWLEMYNTMRDHGRKGSSLEAISAVDIALWDIAGKYFGVPCYMLTGRKYQLEVKAYATGFYRKKKAEDQHDDLIAEALGYANAGFDSMKIKIGFDFKEDIYGKDLEIFPIFQLRPEKKFASTDHLKNQIKQDIEAARNYIAEHELKLAPSLTS